MPVRALRFCFTSFPDSRNDKFTLFLGFAVSETYQVSRKSTAVLRGV